MKVTCNFSRDTLLFRNICFYSIFPLITHVLHNLNYPDDGIDKRKHNKQKLKRFMHYLWKNERKCNFEVSREKLPEKLRVTFHVTSAEIRFWSLFP